MALNTWLIYLLAALGLSLTPGPNSLLVLTHGALHGHQKTGFTVAGGAIGFAALIGLSMLGIGALLQASAHALLALKLLGGAYLVWLGVQLWRAPPVLLAPEARRGDDHPLRLFRQGLLTALSNPKALLFYGAFLPQFIDPQRPLWPQFLVMAGTFVVVEVIVEQLLALLAQRVRGFLQRAGRRFNRLCGGLFVLMGLMLPTTAAAQAPAPAPAPTQAAASDAAAGADDAARHVQFVQEFGATCVARNGVQILMKNTHPTRRVRVWLDRVYMGKGTGDRSRTDLVPGAEPDPLGCSRNQTGVQEWRIVRAVFID